MLGPAGRPLEPVDLWTKAPYHAETLFGYVSSMQSIYGACQAGGRGARSGVIVSKPLIAPMVGLLCLGLVSERADARRRKPRGQLYGSLSPKVLDRTGVRLHRAYWMFGVPSLQWRRVRHTFAEYVVCLDVWNESLLKTTSDPEMVVRGVALVPRVLVIPRRTDRVRIVFRNQDDLKYRLMSTDNAALRDLILVPNAREVATLEGILPLAPGAFLRYRVRDVERSSVRGEILFLRSTAYTTPAANGRFRLRWLPKGTHRLLVIHRGKVVLKKKVTVGRRPLNLKVLTPKP